ncbi:MAG: hypothetical protein RLZZ399_2638 [Verrucomicrobiota bacterium]|jgi:cytochrome c5
MAFPPFLASLARASLRVWLFVFLLPAPLWAVFAPGDLVRLKRNETLLFMGETFLFAPKGQEFTVFKHEPGKDTVYVAFIQKEGAVIAVTLPEASLETVPPDAWTLLQKATEAFRDQRFEVSRRLIAQAAQDADFKALAVGVSARMETVLGAAKVALPVVQEVRSALASLGSSGGDTQKQALRELQERRLSASQQLFCEHLAKARDTALELDRLGYTSLALPFDEGLDRLHLSLFGNRYPSDQGAGSENGLGASKADRAAWVTRVNRAAFALVRCRQAIGVRRMLEASSYVTEGLQHEPGHPGLKVLRAKVEEALKDADDRFDAAYANRQGRHLGQGLLALERGLKICADHPKLLELRKTLSGALEEGASPAVNEQMVVAAKGAGTRDTLEQGRTLYMNRCTECHDLEMLDSRSASGWKSMVRSMAGKARLKDSQEALIVAYLAAAREALPASKTP